jgi:hypothetical protein
VGIDPMTFQLRAEYSTARPQLSLNNLLHLSCFFQTLSYQLVLTTPVLFPLDFSANKKKCLFFVFIELIPKKADRAIITTKKYE